MNTLFEEFIGRALQTALHGGSTRVTLQGPKRHALTDVDGRTRFATIPDIVVYEPTGRWIIDTKWKRLEGEIDDPKLGVSQADVYQMMAYASVYCCKKLLLLYPHHAGLNREAGRISDFAVNGTDAQLSIASIDLSYLPSVPAQLTECFRWTPIR